MITTRSNNMDGDLSKRADFVEAALAQSPSSLSTNSSAVRTNLYRTTKVAADVHPNEAGVSAIEQADL
ncbi:hypothetical protein [Bradyrhizobium sp. LMG 9283]|uniref:hypothetical protein n=1 Tax=Bradyrhizobium sp. LMG 9283 TaxID=592064 RepID=UPI00388D1E62